MNKRLLAALVLSALPFAGNAETPLSPRTQGEIDHLLDYIAHSDCRFNRNGSWHGMDEARDHITMKLEQLRKHGPVDSTEFFIEKAASRSMLSGKNYLVQCPGMPERTSEDWLKSELDRWRRLKS